MTPGASAAFVDVDETLISGKSMFDFLSYYAATARPALDAAATTRKLVAMSRAGASREEVNRAYYRVFEGERSADVIAAGSRWFRNAARRIGFYHRDVLDALDRDRAAGRHIVLVSGSFAPVLEPIGRDVGAKAVLSTALVQTQSGIYTGEVYTPVIGLGKLDAVRRFAAAHRVDLATSVAYGDHPSDLPMLRATGTGIVVGSDREMTRLARRTGLTLIDATTRVPA